MKSLDLVGIPPAPFIRFTPPLMVHVLLTTGKKAELFYNVFVNENTFCIRRPALLGPSCTKSVFCVDNVTTAEVAQAVRSLPNKPSTGCDGISYWLQKEAGLGVIMPLTFCLTDPLLFLLHRRGTEYSSSHTFIKDRRLPYRPIALTSCVAQFLEKLIN